MDIDSFTVYVKAGNVYKDITKNIKKRFDTSNYESKRLLLKEKNKNVIGLMKKWVRWKIMKEFVGLGCRINNKNL